MIKATDLRIGNWVNKKFNKGYPKDVLTMQVSSIGYDNLLPDYCIVDGIQLLEITPIPITSEILEKAGFVYKSGNFHWYEFDLGDNFKFVLKNCPKSQVYLHNGAQKFSTGKFIGYVHDLQNVFHSLSGTELQIEL